VSGLSFLHSPYERQRWVLTLTFLFLCILRITDVIRNPQFWAEDGSIFFRQNLCDGASAIGKTHAGYFHLVPRLIALLAGAFRPTYLPALYIASALILAGVVLYLVQSPRLRLPMTSLLALAIAVCPAGLETYANLTNIQWFLCLGVLASLLMQPTQSKVALILEVIFVAVAGLSGPFVLLLLPIFAVRLLRDWKNQADRKRMLVLTLAAATVSTTQVYALLNNPITTGIRDLVPIRSGDIPFEVGAAICTHTLGTLLQHTIGRLLPTTGIPLEILGLIGFVELGCVLFVVLSTIKRPQFRYERMAMLYFGCVVLLSAIYKFRDNLPSLIPLGNGSRYFLIPTLMAAWLLISSVREPRVGLVSKVLLAVLLASALLGFRRDSLINYNWPFWAHQLEAGAQPQIPTNPPGWFIVTDCKLPQPEF
jgi:hypothetical protein